MTDDAEEHLTREQAAQLWKRAARLQAEALERREEADRPREPAVVEAGERYALTHVRDAAIEAGIGAEFVDSALVEMEADALVRKRRTGGVFAQRLLDGPADSVTVRRVIDAPPRRVLEAMEDVFTRDQWHLTLTERRGDPLDGGLLVFRIEGAVTMGSEGFRYQAAAADMAEVLVAIRPTDETAGRTEVTLVGPLSWAFRRNAAIGSVFAGMGGVLGLALGTVAVAVLAPLGLTAGAAVTAASGAGTGWLSLLGFRRLYRRSIGFGRAALESLAAAVAVEAQGGFGLDGPASLPPGDAGG